MTLRRTSDDLSLCTDMASDYIYIFCIPSSSGSRLSTSEYCGAGPSIELTSDTLLYVPTETSSVAEEPSNCPMYNSTDCPAVRGQSTNSQTDIPTSWTHQSNEDQRATSSVEGISSNYGSLISPRTIEIQTPENCSPRHAEATGMCTLGLSPSMLSPDSQDMLMPTGDGFQLRTESWFALPPYSPSVPRSSMRRNIRRSARINLDGSRCARRSRRTGHLFLISTTEEGDKQCCSRSCCLRFLMAITSFRWILLFFALIGVSCIISGIVLGSLHMAVGNSFLTLSIMFIGLGVLLVVVIGIGWRCTPSGHEPCHLLFNLGDHLLRTSSTRDRHLRRLRHHNSDHNQWFGGVIYPEFEYRTPPPSYSDSVQDRRQVQHCATVHSTSVGPVLPDSPPPAYRSETGTLYNGAHAVLPQSSEVSQPPSYRRHSHRRTPLASIATETVPASSSGSLLYLGAVNSDLNETGDQCSAAVVKVLASGELHMAQRLSERVADKDVQTVQLSSAQQCSVPGSVASSNADLLSAPRPSYPTDEYWPSGAGFSASRSFAMDAAATDTNTYCSQDDVTSVNSDHFTIDIAV